MLGFVAIKGGTGGDGETMDSFTLLLSNQQQRVKKRPKMDVANRSRSAFDPYSGAIVKVRMAQSPQMRKPLEWRRHERPMQPHNEVERSQE